MSTDTFQEDAQGEQWIERLGLYLRALDDADFPEDSICHHLGVNVRGAETESSIGIMPDPEDRGILITFYQGGFGLTAATFERVRAGVAKFGATVREWNGKEGNDGISIVVSRPMPLGFVRALANYRCMKDVLRPTDEDHTRFDAFSRVLDEKVAELESR